jgi:AraC-like DNA-binding protein
MTNGKSISGLFSSNRFQRLILDKTGEAQTIQTKEDSLFFVLEGKMRISFNDKINMAVEGKQFFLFPSASSFLVQVPEKTSLLICQFSFEKAVPESFFAHLPEVSKQKEILLLDFKGRLEELLSLICGYLKDDVDNSVLYDLILQELFQLIAIYYTKEEIAAFFRLLLGADMEFKKFVLQNCMNIEKVEQLAKLANYSTSGFIKKFQRIFRQSPYKWIVEYRAQKIIQDIYMTHIPLKEIADKYNFATDSYFYTFCKKHYGYSPSEIRKQGIWKKKNTK